MARLPIVTYNAAILREKTKPVDPDDPALESLIDDMFDTMYHAHGVGLAAPQVGKLLQLFVMDADPLTEELDEPDQGPRVFINPKIVRSEGSVVELEEGCLSIPEVRDKIRRPSNIVVKWLDRSLNEQQQSFDGWISRVIQHEYDHLQGKLFLDYLSAFRKRLHRSRLKKIDAGTVQTDYPLAEKEQAPG